MIKTKVLPDCEFIFSGASPPWPRAGYGLVTIRKILLYYEFQSS